MDIRGRHWVVALSGALLVHAGVAALIFWQPPRSGAASAGMGGIEVSLGPTGGAPGGEARPVEEVDEAETAEPAEFAETETPPEEMVTEPPETEATETMEPVEPPDTPVETAPAERPEPAMMAEAMPVSQVVDRPVEVTTEPIETAKTVVPPEQAEAEPPDTARPREARVKTEDAEPSGPVDSVAETPVTEIAEQPAPDMAEPVESTVADARDVPVEQITADAPEPPAEVEPPQAVVARNVPPPTPQRRPEQAETRKARAAPSTPGAGGRAGTQASPEAGSSEAESGGGRPGETADYLARLQAWLERHKEYPRGAQRRRQEGAALLYFVMDRDGRVIQYRLQRSSGHDALDQAVIAMIERAQPLPKIPKDMGRNRLELVVPVQFFLR